MTGFVTKTAGIAQGMQGTSRKDSISTPRHQTMSREGVRSDMRAHRVTHDSTRNPWHTWMCHVIDHTHQRQYAVPVAGRDQPDHSTSMGGK